MSEPGAPSGPSNEPSGSDAPETSPLQRTLDLLFYAPLGVAVNILEDLPGFAARGRQEISNARIVGKFVVDQGQREVTNRLTSLFSRGSDIDDDVTTDDDLDIHSDIDADADAATPHPEFAATTPAPSAPLPHTPRPAPDPADAALVEQALADYDTLSASQVVRRLESLGPDELRAVQRHEASHRNRRTILNRTSQLLGESNGSGNGHTHGTTNGTSPLGGAQ